MKLVVCVLVYALATVFLGFSMLFGLLGNGPLSAWPQYLDIVALQFAFPKRAPFALIYVLFVVAVPMLLGFWHWLGLRKARAGSTSVATRTAVVVFGGYLVVVIAVLSMSAAGPAFSVMEKVNLQSSLMMLGVWSVVAVVLAMPAGAVINRLLQPRGA